MSVLTPLYTFTMIYKRYIKLPTKKILKIY